MTEESRPAGQVEQRTSAKRRVIFGLIGLVLAGTQYLVSSKRRRAREVKRLRADKRQRDEAASAESDH
jgi:hypothetical protein